MASEEELKAAMELDAKEDESSSDEITGQEDAGVETLVAGRAKRATAGNRMSSMVAEISADDDLELLFAEDDEGGPDEAFEEDFDDGGSDNDLGDSSDDEDQGPVVGAEDLEGEKEIEKQAKEERKRKRKAQQAFTRPSKKIKHVPLMGAPSLAQLPRPKKKIERLTWMPALGEATRSSRREATTAQSDALKVRIEQREEERKLLAGKLEAAAKRREEARAKMMTQAEHLMEAAQVEKENSKSLNRWEAMERERQEEQRARLAALQNRQLSGPVVSIWSGPARWLGDRLSAVGLPKIKEAEQRELLRAEREKEREEKQKQKQKEERERQKDAEQHSDIVERLPSIDPGTNESNPGLVGGRSHARAGEETVDGNVRRDSTDSPSMSVDMAVRPRFSGSPSQPAASTKSAEPTPEPFQIQPPSLLQGRQSPVSQPGPILQAACPTTNHVAGSVTSPQSQDNLSTPTCVVKEEPMVSPSSIAVVESGQTVASLPTPKLQPALPSQPPQIIFSVQPGLSPTMQSSEPNGKMGTTQAIAPSAANVQIPGQAEYQIGPPPGPPPEPEIAARVLVSLMNVELGGKNEPSTINSLPPSLRESILVAKVSKTKKTLSKPPPVPLCSVTGLPVKYRDPATGVGYANSYAYRQLKKVAEGRLRWSELGGCYISVATATPAHGVPEGFAKHPKVNVSEEATAS